MANKASKTVLFEDSSSDESESLNVNKKFADNYDKWKTKEEYLKCEYRTLRF